MGTCQQYSCEEEEEAEALLISRSNSSRSDVSPIKLEQPRRKNNLCIGFLTLVIVILISSVAFLLNTKKHALSLTTSKASNLTRAQSSKQVPSLTSPRASNHMDSPRRDAIVATQIENFKNGQALMVNVHITHHGGTVFCAQVGKKIGSPDFACLSPRPPLEVGADFPPKRPWTHEDTPKNIAATLKYFKMISWEFHAPPTPKQIQLPDTDFENPNLVSVYIAREPISRLLAGDGYVKKNYPNVHTESKGTLEEWMKFARDDKHTNNFALRVLSGYDCCQGNNTDPIHLERAKNLTSRFTYILDIACLDDGMQALVDELGLNVTIEESQRNIKKHQHKPTEERIPYPLVYEFLKERNKLDIELYEWSRSRSLVDCEALKAGGRRTRRW